MSSIIASTIVGFMYLKGGCPKQVIKATRRDLALETSRLSVPNGRSTPSEYRWLDGASDSPMSNGVFAVHTIGRVGSACRYSPFDCGSCTKVASTDKVLLVRLNAHVVFSDIELKISKIAAS